MQLRSFLVIILCLGVTGQLPLAAAETAPAPSTAPAILVLGDSLSAGYGIAANQAWPVLLQQRLGEQAPGYRVINASISGETTAGGVTRLSALLDKHNPDIVILELGANDGLRGLSLDAMRDNLDNMIKQSLAQRSRVLLVGILLPPNYGPAYTRDFAAIYRDLAQGFNIPLVPFLLDGVVFNAELLQDDGLHPTAAAQPQLLDNVWSHLEPLLKR
jgi:acyl-CoA thioesterase-1